MVESGSLVKKILIEGWSTTGVGCQRQESKNMKEHDNRISLLQKIPMLIIQLYQNKIILGYFLKVLILG